MTVLGAPVQLRTIPSRTKWTSSAAASTGFASSITQCIGAILKNSLSMPKLLYLHRTSDCSDNTHSQFDRSGLFAVLNVDINDTQWLQATLPVRLGVLRLWQLLPSWHQLSWAQIHGWTGGHVPCFLKWKGRLVFCPPYFLMVDIFNTLIRLHNYYVIGQKKCWYDQLVRRHIFFVRTMFSEEQVIFKLSLFFQQQYKTAKMY